MIENRILRELVAESLSTPIPKAFERDININFQLNKVTVLAGIRRSGKTYELYNIMNSLIKTGIPRANLFYINFEDERLRGIDARQLDDIIQIYYELSNYSSSHQVYLFFDELQNVDGWSQWVRRLYDSNKYKIFITGSSSKLLSREIATALAGRNITHIVYPLSFNEVLNVKGISVKGREIYSKRGIFNKYLSEYIKFGGFPEVVLLDSIDDRIRLLSSYYDAIIYRDVIERYRIRDTNALSMVFRYAISAYAKDFSSTKAYNYFKSIGIKMSKKTINAFISYGESVFLLHLLYKFSRSFKKSQQSRRKMYLADPGLLRLSESSEDLGRLLENAVYMELLRRKEKDPLLEINYLESGSGEVDFAVSKYKRIMELIQVTYELTPDNEKRETNALAAALEEFGARSAEIVTFDSEGVKKIGRKTVKVMPFIRWQNEG